MKEHKYYHSQLALKKIQIVNFLTLILLLSGLLISANAVSQNKVTSTITDSQTSNHINGCVTNIDSNEPLIGVSVRIKGSNIGTITDLKGNFTLPVPSSFTNKELVLSLSYIGFSSKEVKVGKLSNIDIKLKENVSNLDEVVVVGYGTVKKRDLTGSVSSVNSKVLTESKVNSFAEALQGKVAGVRVTSQSGEPGATVNIEIRGANSINAGTSPLYVIDGVPMDPSSNDVASSSVGGNTTSNPLATIAPEDIESIEILKDASSAAIYGARGANGVIIITTKSAKEGSKTTFNLNISDATQTVAKKTNMLNGQEYVNYRHELAPTDIAWGTDTNGDGTIDIAKDVSGYQSHNWQDELYRTGSIKKVNLSMQGSAKNTTYSGGLGYLDQAALVKNNDYKSYSGRFRLDTKASDKVDVGLSVNWGKTINTGVASSGGGTGNWSGIIQSIYTFRPIILSTSTEDAINNVSLSSIIDKDNVYKETDYSNLVGSVYLKYNILKNLSLKISGGGNTTGSKLSEFYSTYTLWGNTVNGRAGLTSIQTGSTNGTATLDYQTKVFKGHLLKLMGGFEVNTYKYESFSVSSTNFVDQSTGVFDISKGSAVALPQSNVYDVNRMSFFGRVNYDIMSKYLFTGTLRDDGSSNFGKGNRFALFPSMAFAWRINQESLLKDVDKISDMKLRLSYGQTGNDRITPYQSQAKLSSTYYSSNGGTTYGTSPSTAANPNLKWETTAQYNLGLDLGFFKQRLTLTADAYYKKTSDMLLNAQVAGETGFSTQWLNIGSMENKGVELTINTVNFDTKKFSWRTSFNMSLNRNKILSLGGTSSIPVIIQNGYMTNVGIVKEGQPLGTAYGYKWTGVYQISDFTWQNNSDPTIAYSSRKFVLNTGVPSVAGVTVKPGDLKYKDLNGDGTVDSNDRTIISNSNPKFSGGFSNDFRYKNFTLSMFFEGVYGNQIFNGFKSTVEGNVDGYNLTHEYWYNRWTPDNATNLYPAITNSSKNIASSYYVEDGSYLRFKTLSLAYSFDKKVLNFLHVSTLKFYGTIDNVCVWTNYSGLDPDIQSVSNLLRGFDRLSYPRAHTYIFGLEMTF